MASPDDKNPFRHAPKGETAKDRQARTQRYYSWQRTQAEADAARGDNKQAGRASKIYGKIVDNERGANASRYRDRDSMDDMAQKVGYGDQSHIPGPVGVGVHAVDRVIGNPANAMQGGVGDAVGKIIGAVAPMIGAALKGAMARGPQGAGNALARVGQPAANRGAGAVIRNVTSGPMRPGTPGQGAIMPDMGEGGAPRPPQRQLMLKGGRGTVKPKPNGVSGTPQKAVSGSERTASTGGKSTKNPVRKGTITPKGRTASADKSGGFRGKTNTKSVSRAPKATTAKQAPAKKIAPRKTSTSMKKTSSKATSAKKPAAKKKSS